TDRLQALGARIAIGHDAANIEGANAVVVSTAVRSDNPEVLAARAQRVRVVAPRGERRIAGRIDRHAAVRRRNHRARAFQH
ncbi:hypothetical protein LAN32_26160, partial [Mycobacterium tuberculosis]|nr:hypothetical protein [Mycobacterium tuberculosis]